MAEIPNTLENRAHIIAARTGWSVATVRAVLEAAEKLDEEIRFAVGRGSR